MMHGNHLKHMAIGGAVLLGLFLAVGVPLGRALPYAVFLACPLMMVAMMFMMGRGMNGQAGPRHDHHDESTHERMAADTEPADSAPRR